MKTPSLASTTTVAIAILAAAAVLPTPTQAAIEYLSNPLQVWAVSSAPPTGKNNAVQIAPDGTLLFVTSTDGTLTALDPDTGTKGSIGFGVQARPIEEGWTVECTSGVAFHEDVEGKDGSSYLVYAVIDVPPRFSNDEVMSRVFAMNHPMTKNPRWISAPIPGRISGTPAIGSDGEYIYFTHNTESYDDDENDNGDVIGHFSLISDSLGGEVLYTESDPEHEAGVDDPWAPVGMVHNPIEGNYLGGKDNSNDLLAWGTMPGSDADLGHTYVFQMPIGSTGYSATDSDLIVVLQEVGWSTLSAPALSKSGYDLYFGISFSKVRGWVTRRFGDTPTWKTNLDGDGKSPPPSAAVLSKDERTLFVASTAPIFYALDSRTGDVAWADDGLSSVVQSAVRVSPDGRRVYYVESERGRVHSADAVDGDPYWAYLTGDETLADISVSSDGTVLYLGSTEGRVVALLVGEVDGEPTPRPTPRPTRAPPAPSGPTRRPAPPSEPTKRPTPRPTPASVPTRPPSASVPTRPPSASVPTRPPSASVPTGPTYEPTAEVTELPPPLPPTFAPSTESPTAFPTSDPPSGARGFSAMGGNAVFIGTSVAAALFVLFA